MTQSRNLVPKIALAILIAFFAYGYAVAPSDTTKTSLEVLGAFGTVLLYAVILATFATMFIAARRAHRAGSWPWLLAVIFVWPLSYVYALVVNRHG